MSSSENLDAVVFAAVADVVVEDCWDGVLYAEVCQGKEIVVAGAGIAVENDERGLYWRGGCRRIRTRCCRVCQGWAL